MTHCLRIIRGVHARAIVQEAAALNALSLTLTERIHELLELCGTLDLEEHFVVVVRDLDVEVL